jgi:hypothetical protein
MMHPPLLSWRWHPRKLQEQTKIELAATTKKTNKSKMVCERKQKQ